MAFRLSSEQQEFRELLRRFFAEQLPSGELRRQMQSESGFDPELWKRICSELGLAGLGLPEAQGGSGFGFAELCLALREAGAVLLGAPLFGSAALAGRALLHAASEPARARLLPELAAGEVFALAFVGERGDWDPREAGCEARERRGRFALSGAQQIVLHGHTAERILVVAREPGGAADARVGLYLVEGSAPGLTREALRGLDLTRRCARLRFESSPAERLDAGGDTAAALARALDEARIALANEMLGGLERVLETAVAYARSRRQFGRAIGSFQAIKHKCADLLIATEASRSACQVAAEAVDDADPELPLLAAIAKAQLSQAYSHAAQENVQIHGGVGFTWEYDAHLYQRRAKASEIFLGDARWNREAALQWLAARAAASA